MKKISIIVSIAVAAMAMSASCKKAEITAPADATSAVFEATLEDSATKTTLDGTSVKWSSTDVVAALAINSTYSAYTQVESSAISISADGKSADLTFTGIPEGQSLMVALYPSTSLKGLDAQAFSAKIEIPTEQVAAANSFADGSNVALAVAAGKLLPFKNVMSLVGVEVKNDNIAAITLSDESTAMAGNFMYSPFTQKFTAASDAAKTVTLKGDFQKGKTYYIGVMPGTYSSLKITFSDKSGRVASYANSTAFTAERNKITKLFNAEIPDGKWKVNDKVCKITHMWVYGGTGAEYNSTKVYDILGDKASRFDNTDGRGTTAVLDDYLVLAGDGKFYNWAGADKRHWWMVFDSEATTSKEKDLDATDKYGVLPKNEGTWSIGADGITFTDKDGGRVTKAVLVEAGKHILYQNEAKGIEKSVTITTQALKFTLTGGKDSWSGSDPYSDYGVLYLNPKIMLIEYEELPAGSEVPEASKTTDEVKFKEADPDPDPEQFDLTKLPGRYNVRGTSAAGNRTGLWVLGGSGNDPAFVNPQDKSWIWDDGSTNTIWKETDNGLVVRVSSASATTAAGTMNYYAGLDGQFWNYIYHYGKEDAQDMSSVYGRLPHGDKPFTFDFATMMVTFENGYSAKLLPPGVHNFKETGITAKTLEVPEGSIALDFRIMDPIAATSDHYNDKDRFVNAPLHYVMIFERTGDL